jgi:hypothetical protein
LQQQLSGILCSRQLTLNLGLRYDLGTNSKDISHYGQINPIVQPFLHGKPRQGHQQLGSAHGFQLGESRGNFTIHGGCGIYYDRITLEVMSLERGLNGTSLPIDVRAGNTFYLTRNEPSLLARRCGRIRSLDSSFRAQEPR